jgi:hypothetical protein
VFALITKTGACEGAIWVQLGGAESASSEFVGTQNRDAFATVSMEEPARSPDCRKPVLASLRGVAACRCALESAFSLACSLGHWSQHEISSDEPATTVCRNVQTP